ENLCSAVNFISVFKQKTLVNTANCVYKRLKFFFKLFQFPMLSGAFFHHEKCMQCVFKVLKWTKH
ncbi:unnamed protein product, partial [Staurois parvus]